MANTLVNDLNLNRPNCDIPCVSIVLCKLLQLDAIGLKGKSSKHSLDCQPAA